MEFFASLGADNGFQGKIEIYLGFTHRDHDSVGAAVDGALDHHWLGTYGAYDGG